MAGNDRIKIVVEGDSGDLQAALARSRESIKGVGDESDRQTTRAGRSFDRLRAKLAKPISAKVEADTSAADRTTTRFSRSIDTLRAKLRRPLEARVTADTSGADRGLAGVSARLAAFGRIRAKATATVAVRGMNAVEGGIRRIRSSFDSLRGLRANLAAKVQINGGERLRGFLRSLRTDLAAVGQGSTAAAPGVDRLNSSVSRANQGFSLFRNGMRLLRFPALIAGAGLATQAIGALTAGAVGLAGSLTSSLTVAAVGAGGMFMALGQGAGVAKFALGGIGAAVGGLNEKLDKSSKAWKALSPEGQRFAQTLQRLKAPLRDIQQTAQRGLFPGLTEGLHAAMQNLPVVERLVGRTAKALGDMAASAGKALGSAEWGRDIETIGTRNVAIMRNLGGAAGGVASALRHVAVVGGPVMERLSRDTRAFGKSLADAAARGRASGGMAAFFDRAYNSLKRTWRVTRDFGAALFNIAKIGTREMGPLGDSLERTAKAARRFTESAAGSRKIGEWFRGSLPSLRELGRLVVGVGGSISRLGASPHLAPLIQQIRTRLVPAVEKMLTTMTAVAGPEIVNALASVAELFAAMSPYVAQVAKFVAWAAGGLADLVREHPGVGMLAAGVLALSTALKLLKFTGILGGFKLLGGAVGLLASGYRWLTGSAVGARAAILGESAAATTAAAANRSLAAAKLAAAGGYARLGTAAAATTGVVAAEGAAAGAAGGAAAGGGAMAALKKWGGRGLKFVGGRAILPVGIALTVAEASKAIGLKWFKPVHNIKVIASLLAKPLGSIWKTLTGRDLKKDVQFIGRRVGEVWKDAKKRWQKRIAFVAQKAGELWRSAKNRVRKGIAFVAQKAGTLWRNAKERWRKRLAFVAEKAGELWRSAKDVWKKAIKFAAEAAGDLWRKAKDTWKKAIKFVGQAVGDLWRNAKQTWGKRIDFVANAVGSLWRSAGNTITKIVRFISRGRRAEGGPVLGGFAAGGTPTPTADFAGAPTRKSMGGRHSRPTYLVGEENRPEFVIATNPAYRKANLEYLSMAAAALKAPMVPAFAGGGQTPRRAEDGSMIRNPARYWGGGGNGGGSGGSKFLSFNVTAGFAKGGKTAWGGSGGALGSFNAEDRANFLYNERTPRARRWRGQMRVREPRGRWISPLFYGLQAASERESFYEELGKGRGGRSSREWGSLKPATQGRITRHWESRSDRVGKLQEFWERRFEALNELWGQLTELRGERRGQQGLGRRVQGAQLGVMRGFAGQYVGQFARGSNGVSIPRSVGRSGFAEVHRGERVVPDPRGGYGSQVAVAGQGGPVKVDVTIGFDDRGMLKIVDQRIDGRAADVSSREIGRRTRRIASAPGARRPTYAR